MDKNLVRFGLAAIIILVLFAAFELYPPSEKLKPGIDLAGGTSLIYEIDTTGLQGAEIDNLAQRLSPILLKRIDPGNIQNIIMRPQGDTRIEIQVPLASADTHRKRQAFDNAINAIAEDNINLAIIRRTLTKDPNERAAAFAKFAVDSNDRKQILNQLALAYDTRKIAQEKRDSFKARLDTIAEKLEKAGINSQSLMFQASSWSKLDPNGQNSLIDQLIADANKTEKVFDSEQQKRQQIEQYFEVHRQWAQVVNELTKPETGLNAAYRQAEIKLRDFNLGTEALTAVLEMPEKSIKRAELIEQFKNNFPSRKERIDALVKTFEEYRTVRGRIDGPEDVKRMLKGAGVLEFRILPKVDDGRTNRDEMLTYVEALKTKGPKLASDSKYIWMQIENIENNTWRVTERNQIVLGTFADKYYVLTSNQKGECLLRNTGKKPWKLQKAGTTADQLGKRAISFSFDEVAASLFYDITRNNLQRPLCITLDGLAISAPNIRSAIRSSGIIEGDFTMNEQLDMVNKLNAGSLPARLIEPPISEKTIGASIGADNRDQGIKAGIIALAAVCGFLTFYYLLAGFVATIAIVLNIFFVLAIMALCRATFTLPGIAGLILTVGMSDDANVLIYERIREELLSGSSLRISIDNGYRRAFWTIFDSNLTTIITAIILYMVGSEEIKGFAITLILGIVSSLFTGLFVTRLIFHLLLSKGFIRNRLAMFQIFRQKININWMGLRPVMLTISGILVAASLFAFYMRDDTKNNKYDIEFTGGTSVQIDLKPDNPLDRAEVENIIHDAGTHLGNPAITAARVYSVGNRQSKLQYEIVTTETNKATATVIFNDNSPARTASTITSAILNTQKNMRGVLSGLAVEQDKQNSAKFTVSTSQTNKSLFSAILAKAFDVNTTAISEPVVDEIVSRAVKEAFAGKLQIMENLEPNIISTEKIDDAVVDKQPELTDFLGGIKIHFSVKKLVTLEELNKRLKDLQFKPDMQNIAWYNYSLYDTSLSLQNQHELNDFIYVSTAPEAGYRQFSDEEWTSFVNNETIKITAAGQLQTSLSRVNQFAPSIGKEAKTRALIATVLSLISMAAYLWIRFGNLRYGIGAIISLTHDVCIALGAVVICAYIANTQIGQALLISDFKIDLGMIAAFLTLVGYSVNDTIVVYDRIRENRGRLAIVTPEIITNSINQTLSRTILTSFTTWLAVLIMYIWGGPGFRGFTYVMTIGIVVGTYSSIAIAAPILLLGKKTIKTTKNK
jgi:SecD/SecF fusion protein